MSTPTIAAEPATLSPVRLLNNWRYALRTCNCPDGQVDGVTRWLVLTRACVQPMTLSAVLTAGLLAVRAPGFNVLYFALAAAVVAQVAAWRSWSWPVRLVLHAAWIGFAIYARMERT